jgi:integrase
MVLCSLFPAHKICYRASIIGSPARVLADAVPVAPAKGVLPPLKWAGGKRWNRRLVEPFCGGLAVTTGLMLYKLRLLTAQRGVEVGAMRWADLDLDGAWWTIPAAHTKNKLAHRVPLNASALRILKAMKATAYDDAEYVLGAHHRTKGAGARGKRQQSEAASTFTVKDFPGHDLRRTVASIMASAGINRLTISKILNHVERSVTAVYDRHSYDAEKTAALAWWDRKLAAILEDKAATVLAFARA